MCYLFISLFVLVTNQSIYCTNRPLKHQMVIDFILEYCQYKDTNPMWQPDADSISVLFHDILYADEKAEKKKLKIRALELLYKNTAGTFEDAVDADRMGRRRALCFIALALFEDEYRYKAFMDDARVCLSKINPNNNCINEYALIDMIETFIMMSFGDSQIQLDLAIEKLHQNIKLLKNQNKNLSEFTKDYINLLSLITENKI